MVRRKFDEKEKKVGKWIERKMDEVNEIGMGIKGQIEDKINRMKEYEKGVYEYKKNIEEMEKIKKDVKEGMIFEKR